MRDPLISIIIPVYKVEPYLDKCVASVVGQTYRNLEIILVDDGSPDGCPRICDVWAEKDSRIKVIHQANGGLSNARKAGIEYSTGEYIGFVDSDDWIEPHMYETLYLACEKHKALMSVCGRYDEYEDKRGLLKGRCPNKEGIVFCEAMLPKMFLGDEYDSSVWDKLFHRTLWNGIRFPGGKVFEDIFVMYRVVIAAQRIALCNAPLYHYCRRANSITAAGFREEVFDYPEHTKVVLADIAEQIPAIKESAVWAHMQAIEYVLRKIAKAEEPIYRKYKKHYRYYVAELRQYRYVWRKSELFSRRERLKCEILSKRWLTRLIWKR